MQAVTRPGFDTQVLEAQAQVDKAGLSSTQAGMDERGSGPVYTIRPEADGPYLEITERRRGGHGGSVLTRYTEGEAEWYATFNAGFPREIFGQVVLEATLGLNPPF